MTDFLHKLRGSMYSKTSNVALVVAIIGVLEQLAPGVLAWVGAIKGWPAPPELNLDLLWVVITGLLGIGSMRSFEKLKGVAK